MNSQSNFNETYWEYSIAPTDDLIKFWRSKVKVTVDRLGGEGVQVHLLVYIFVVCVIFSALTLLVK